MKKLFVFLFVANLISLTTLSQNTWTGSGDSNRGTQLYSSQGALGYSIRTNTGGGWAWQFVDGGNTPYFHVQYPTGYVGIGTTAPRGKLDVDGPGDIYLSDDPNTGIDQSVFLPGHIYIAPHAGSNLSYLQARRLNNSGTTSLRIRTSNAGSLTDAMQIEGNGNVGIGTTTPNEKLSVQGNIQIPLASSLGFLQTTDKFTHNGNLIGNYSLGWSSDTWLTGAPTGYFSSFGGIKLFTRATLQLVIDYNGNVGIGTAAPDAKLAVNGTIHSKEVKVDLTNWPDYVFNSDYNLLSLEEIKTYIDKNKHLPEVPSAKEMEANGVNLGEMNMLLLKKIEELTLHMIRQEEQSKLQTEEINRLKEMIKTN